MRLKLLPVFLLSLTILSSSSFSLIAQDESTSTSSADDIVTNAVPLYLMMESNNIVTNTAGIVLVKISSKLWAGQFEVTQKSYNKVMKSNPSAFSGDQNPVDSVSWDDAMAFCKTLTEAETKDNQLTNDFAYSLPTQDQWVKLAGDATLDQAVMSLPGYNKNSSTKSVGSLKPNNLGLYDTRGNVMEWCLDPQDKPFRVLRGGAWDTFSEPSSRIEFRNYAQPTEAKSDYGFRVVLEAPGQ